LAIPEVLELPDRLEGARTCDLKAAWRSLKKFILVSARHAHDQCRRDQSGSPGFCPQL